MNLNAQNTDLKNYYYLELHTSTSKGKRVDWYTK